MADPLSIAASIAGLFSLAGSVFGTLCQLSQDLKDFKREISELQNQTRGLSNVLHDLSLLATALETEQSFDSSFRLEHVDACEKTLHEIKSRLDKIRPLNATGSKRVKSVIDRLKWPYTSQEFQKLLADLTRHRETISLALSVDSMKGLLQSLSKQRELTDGVEEIRDTVREIKTRIFIDEHRQKVLDFFTPVNPQINLETSLRLRHPLTGLWLIESDEFKDWMGERNGKLWMSGIPGAGKTVIAGSAIEQALQTAAYTTSVGACFFFCDYKDPKSQDLANILSSFASQLARQDDQAYDILDGYYTELHPERRLPKSIELAKMRQVVIQMSHVFDQVFIVVDGLDECGPDSPVTSSLSDIPNECQSVSMGLLSRDELLIRDAHADFQHIDIAAKRIDVRRYVREELESRIKHRKLRLRSGSLKEDIINTLIERAGGMFRWVSCQLDYLCDLPMDKDRREALTKLPPTLGATYERMLSQNTHPTAIHIASTCLTLVAMVGPHISIPALCEAVSVPEGATRLKEDDAVFEEDIVLYCSSLLRKSQDGEHFEFAHFTVQEFLQSDSLLGTPLESYHIGPDSMLTVIELCLRFLLLENFNIVLDPGGSPSRIAHTAKNICNPHPFYDFAAQWPFLDHGFLRAGKRTGQQLSKLEPAIHLFSKESQVHSKLWAIVLFEQTGLQAKLRLDSDSPSTIENIVTGEFSALSMACTLAIPWLVTNIAGGDSRFLLSRNGPMQYLLFGLQLLVAPGTTNGGVFRVWEDQVPTVVWVDAIASLVEHGLELPDKVISDDGPSVNILQLVIVRHYHTLGYAKVPDPTESILKLLRIGLRAHLDVVLELEKATAWFCSATSPDKRAIEERIEEIRQILPLRCLDPAAVERMREVLQRRVESLSLDTDAANPPGMQELDSETFKTRVQDVVKANNPQMLRLFVSDKRYKTVERGHGDRSLLRLAMDHGCDDSFRHLLANGCDGSVVDSSGDTIWHSVARDGSLKLLRLLKTLSQDPMARQEDKSNHGDTPIRVAVDYGNYDVACELLPLCRSSKCFLGSPSIYALLLQWGNGSPGFLGELSQSGTLANEGQRAIYQIELQSDPHTVKRLLSFWPESCDRRSSGRLPIEALLSKVLAYRGDFNSHFEEELVKVLLPTSHDLRLEAFQFFCSEVITQTGESSILDTSFPSLLAVVLDQFAGIAPFALQLLINSLYAYARPATSRRPRLRRSTLSSSDRWCQLDSIVYGTVTRGYDSISLSEREEFIQVLLHTAVFMDWQILLKKASIDRSQSLDHLIFSLTAGKDYMAKLESLLQHGVNTNSHDAVSGKPAVLFHLTEKGPDTSLLLLHYGADPQAQLEGGFDVVCGLVWHDLVDELDAFRQKYPGTIWTKSFNIPPEIAVDHGLSEAPDNSTLQGLTLLHLAALRSSVECLKYLVEHGLVDVNQVTNTGYTCAHFVAASCQDQTVPLFHYLQRRGCDINTLDGLSRSPLDIAIREQNNRPRIGAFVALLDMGCQISHPSSFDHLHLNDAVYLVNEMQARCARTSNFEECALYAFEKAILEDELPICRELASLGCPLDRPLPGCGSCAPLLHALYHGASRITDWLLDHGRIAWGEPCRKVGDGQNAISLAVAHTELNSVLIRLLHRCQGQLPAWIFGQRSPILEAIHHSNIDALETVLAFVNDPGSESTFSRSRHHARVDPMDETIEPMPNVADVLNHPHKKMALHAAATQGSIPMIELLLSYGVNIDAHNADGKRPVYLAAKDEEEEVVDFLLRQGATVESPTNDFASLLHSAAHWDDLEFARVVTPYCLATDSLTDWSGMFLNCSEEFFEHLLAHGFEPDGEDDDGTSHLHHLLAKENIQSLVLHTGLITKHGLDKVRFPLEDLTDDALQTLLDFVPEILRVLGPTATATMFPPHPTGGNSALFHAADFKELSCCRALISIGADLERVELEWGTPLAAAVHSGYLDMVKVLVGAGAQMQYFDPWEKTWKSAFSYAHRHPKIWHWLLVGRYTEQRRILE